MTTANKTITIYGFKAELLHKMAPACAVPGHEPCPNKAEPGLTVQGDPSCDECYHDADVEDDWLSGASRNDP